jgi:hypothetical protein
VARFRSFALAALYGSLTQPKRRGLFQDAGLQSIQAGRFVGGIMATTNTTPVPGTTTSWHQVVLWFLGAIALLALASPAPNIATMIVVLLIVAVLLTNWSVYKSYLGLK